MGYTRYPTMCIFLSALKLLRLIKIPRISLREDPIPDMRRPFSNPESPRRISSSQFVRGNYLRFHAPTELPGWSIQQKIFYFFHSLLPVHIRVPSTNTFFRPQMNSQNSEYHAAYVRRHSSQ